MQNYHHQDQYGPGPSNPSMQAQQEDQLMTAHQYQEHIQARQLQQQRTQAQQQQQQQPQPRSPGGYIQALQAHYDYALNRLHNSLRQQQVDAMKNRESRRNAMPPHFGNIGSYAAPPAQNFQTFGMDTQQQASSNSAFQPATLQNPSKLWTQHRSSNSPQHPYTMANSPPQHQSMSTSQTRGVSTPQNMPIQDYNMARPAQPSTQMSPNTATPPRTPMNMNLFFHPVDKFCDPNSQLKPNECDKDYFIAASIIVLRKYFTKDWTFICCRIAKVYGRQLNLNTAPLHFATRLSFHYGKQCWDPDVVNALKPMGIILPTPRERGGRLHITAPAIRDIAILRFHTTLEWNEIADVMNNNGQLEAGLFYYEAFALFQVLVHQNESTIREVYDRVTKLYDQHKIELEALHRGARDVNILGKIKNWWDRAAPAAWQPGLAQPAVRGQVFKNPQSTLDHPDSLDGHGNHLNIQAPLGVAPAAPTINAGFNVPAGHVAFYNNPTFTFNTSNATPDFAANNTASDFASNNPAMPMQAIQPSSGQGCHHASTDTEMLAMRLEQKNEEDSVMGCEKQDSMTRADEHPVMPGHQILAPSMSPQRSRACAAAPVADLPGYHQFTDLIAFPIPSSSDLPSSKRTLEDSDDLEILEVRPRAPKRQKPEELHSGATLPVNTNATFNYEPFSNPPCESRRTMPDASSMPTSPARTSSKRALKDSSDPHTSTITPPASKRQKPTTGPKAPSKPRAPRKKKDAEPVVAEPVRKPLSPEEQAELEQRGNEQDERRKFWVGGKPAWLHHENWVDSADGHIHMFESDHRKYPLLVERYKNGEPLSKDQMRIIDMEQSQQKLFQETWAELESHCEKKDKANQEDGLRVEREIVNSMKVWTLIFDRQEYAKKEAQKETERKAQAEKLAQLASVREARLHEILSLRPTHPPPPWFEIPSEMKPRTKATSTKGPAQPRKGAKGVEKPAAKPKKTPTSAGGPAPQSRGRRPKDKNAPAKSTPMVRNASDSSDPLTAASASPVQASTARTTPQRSPSRVAEDWEAGINRQFDRDGNLVLELPSRNPEGHKMRMRQRTEDMDTDDYNDLLDEQSPMAEQPAENVAGEDWAKQNPEEYEAMTQQLTEDLSGADPLLREVADTIRQKGAQASDEPLDPGHFPHTAIEKAIQDSTDFLQKTSEEIKQLAQPTQFRMRDGQPAPNGWVKLDGWEEKPAEGSDLRPLWMRNADPNEDEEGGYCSEYED